MTKGHLTLGTITEINRAANRIAVLLGNGFFTVCRLLEHRGDLHIGETVLGRLAKPGASMVTALTSDRTFRALILGVYPDRASALEMVHC